MKKIQILLITFMTLMLGVSCDDDGGTSAIPLDDGAVPNLVKSATSDAFFDLLKIQDGDNVTVDFSVDVAQGNPTSTDVVGIYKTVNGDVYTADLFSNVSLPQDFSLSVNDIVAAFPELNTAADILLADVLSITTRFTMADGTVLDIIDDEGINNTGTNILTTVLFNSVISYPISCPSDIGGVYNVISNGDNTDGQPPAVNVPYTVTLTDNGGGSYDISDGVAGVYIFWYSIYGYTFETTGNFTDVCGSLSGSWTESFGCGVELTGTVNADGTLSIHWDNCFGDFIDAVYTPQ